VKDNLGDGISIIKSMSIKPRNSIQVSGARCSHNDSFQEGKQLWRESGVDKNAIIKVILDKVINDKKSLITGAGILVGAVPVTYTTAIGCDSGTVSSHPNRLIPLYMDMMGGLVFNMFVKRKKG
jgi:hypothetical protein